MARSREVLGRISRAHLELENIVVGKRAAEDDILCYLGTPEVRLLGILNLIRSGLAVNS